jgi:RNA polymerase primary sigma factor
VLKKYVDTGGDDDEPLVEDATDEHEDSDVEDDEDDEDDDEDSDEDEDPRMRYM